MPKRKGRGEGVCIGTPSGSAGSQRLISDSIRPDAASPSGEAAEPERRPRPHVRRDFRAAIRTAANLDPQDWTPRELRHSDLSLLSDQGVPLGDICRLVGHSSTAVTELVHRKQIRPVLQLGATTMDQIFGDRDRER